VWDVCGICGTFSLRGEPASPALLERMNATLAHRGPDSSGRLVDGPVGLAMQRLSIIDLSGGDQPIANENGDVHVVQNGEIYNYRALREELERRGHRLRTHSDTEVLVHLYEDEGSAFVRRLRGMFAFALWDARRRRLLLARDAFGIKPLYYRHERGELAFGSELKALLAHPGVSRDLDLDAVEAYLALNAVPAPHSIFREIRKLPAGHVLVADADGVTLERFARPGPVQAAETRRESEAELAEELRTVLRDSVSAHLVSDVPVGVMLSGGIDSSALVALASEQVPRVQTFSIGFDEPSYDERRLARLVAERYGTDHHELVVRPQALELLPALVEAYDEPFADSSAVPTYLVSQLAVQDVKVALSGEGGDELFGGYYTYVADLMAPRVGPVARALRPLIERLPTSAAKASLDYKAKRFARAAHLPPLERHHGWKEIFSADARAELLRPDRRAERDPLLLLAARYAETEGAQQLARLQDVDVGVYLADDLLVKTDRASMANSLEARVPFCDEAVARFALALPDRMKVRGLSKKRLLRRAVEPLLPREIVHGRKQGFSIPNAAWLRHDLQPLVRDMLSAERLRRQGLFRPEAVGPLVDRHASGREDLSRQLWSLLVFSLWYERWVERPAASAAA
jgi:asparagine synthase (glutamine-hydrolysing)